MVFWAPTPIYNQNVLVHNIKKGPLSWLFPIWKTIYKFGPKHNFTLFCSLRDWIRVRKDQLGVGEREKRELGCHGRVLWEVQVAMLKIWHYAGWAWHNDQSAGDGSGGCRGLADMWLLLLVRGTLTGKASGVMTRWKLRCVSGCSHWGPVTSSLSVSVWFVTEANALFALAVMWRNESLFVGPFSVSPHRYNLNTLLEHVREKRNVYRFLVGKPKGKRLLGRPMHRWEYNGNVYLRVE